MSLAGVLLSAALSVSTEASPPPTPPPTLAVEAPSADASDPLERLNRRTYRINLSLDRYIFRPVAVSYRRVLPRPVRRALHAALMNWDEPGVCLNDLLQGRLKDASTSGKRFVVNSTLGVGGAFDVAQKMNLPHHENGFAITLGRYGVGAGPYLFVPFLGPSSTRDLFGAGVDFFSNPLVQLRGLRTGLIEKIQTVTSVVDQRASVEDDLETIAMTATDPYASLRSIYQQRMRAQVSGDQFSLVDSPDIPGAPELPPGVKKHVDPPPPSQPGPTQLGPTELGPTQLGPTQADPTKPDPTPPSPPPSAPRS